MSEATETVTEAPPSRAELIAAAGAAADAEAAPAPEAEAAPEVISVEDVAGKTAPAPVAQGLREFLREQQAPAEPTGLEREIADLRGALDGLAAPQTQQEVSLEQKMLTKLEALEQRFAERDAADAQAAAEEAYNNRVRAFREGLEANIKAQEDKYPGLVALGQFDTVFNELAKREHDGTESSDDEVASEVETGLREVYETLSKVYGTPSEDSKPGERKQTLTPGLASTEEAVDTSNMSRPELQEYLWDKNLNQ